MTMPTGFVKSTSQAPGAAALRSQLGEVQDQRHRPQRLGEPAGAGRLLADRAERRRQGLVGQSCRLAADPQLDQHEVGAIDGASRGRRS